MDWLAITSKVLAKAEIPTSWVTPIGFPVVQKYNKEHGKRLNLIYGGKRMRINLAKEVPRINVRRQAQACPPNFVHSLDAAHLMKSVNRCLANGVDSFAMIHDSFGTHAGGSTEIMWKALREEFLEMYSGNILEEFYQDLLLRVPPEVMEDIPPPPLQGDADLTAVLHSDFFFA